MEYLSTKMEIGMKENGLMIFKMEAGKKHGLMVQYSKEHIRMASNMEKDTINGLMEVHIKDS